MCDPKSSFNVFNKVNMCIKWEPSDKVKSHPLIKLVELVRVVLGEIKYKRMFREKRDIIIRRRRQEREREKFQEGNFWFMREKD